jgi:hypothetical protein
MRKFLILTIIFSSLLPDACGQDFELIPYRVKTKWGYADSTGTIKIEPIYDNVIPFNHGYSAFKKDEKWGFIDLSGEEILAARYDSVGKYFQKVLFKSIETIGLLVFNEGIEDFVDPKGESLKDDKKKSNYINEDLLAQRVDISNRIELIKKNNKIGFKLKWNGFTVEPEYDSLVYSDTDIERVSYEMEPPYFLAKKNGMWGIIYTDNSEKLAFEYENLIEVEFGGNKLFKKNGKWGIINHEYGIELRNEYDSILCENGYHLIKFKNKWGVLDFNLVIVIPFYYENIRMSLDASGFYVESRQNKWGYCNLDGKIIVPLEYTYLEKFQYKDAFKFNKKPKGNGIGLIGYDLKTIIVPKYKDVGLFYNGYAKIVNKNGKTGYVNKDGLEFFRE